MASLQKTYSKEKLSGQIYTPSFIVKKILNDIGYISETILDKTILDPACGDGRFLTEIANRIIKFSPEKDLKENLTKIYGWDIDKEALNDTEIKLNKMIAPFNFEIEWNLFHKNSLKEIDSKQFDYIVGNPPYIRIQHLEEKQRIYIQDNYKFCKKGSTDIYIAFFEVAIRLLKPTGICGYITPNTFFNTETGKELRVFLEKAKTIKQITNYGAIQLFDNATTYSSITVFSKKKQRNFLYQEAKTKQSFKEREINFSEIRDSKFWQLSVKENNDRKGVRLGDICDIHVGITTLADKAYIFEKYTEQGEYIFAETHFKGKVRIEKGILKPIIKASLLKNTNEAVSRFVLFPYYKQNSKNVIIKENELKKTYPLAYDYLLSVKNILDKRDNGKANKTAWYAFGRSQGLNTSFGKKILFSPMNKKPKFILVNNTDATFYSGYCIKYTGNYKALLKQLNSEKMEEFIKVSSRDFRGGWKAYNKKIVQEFMVD